jgi:ectoine hydroxylase-related dioxygenase (phytanoyl-CoA dioxygenase family)
MMRGQRPPEEITMSTPPAFPAPTARTEHREAASRRPVDPGEQVDAALVEKYARDGFVVLPDVLTSEEVAAVNAEAVALCRGELGGIRHGEEDSRSTPADAGPPVVDDDADVLRRFLCIHHPHKVSTLIRDTIAHPRLLPALTSVIGPNVKSMQTMLFVKSEGKPGQAWHQDEHFIPTRDRSLTAAWIALDEATVENGCLWVLPGSHRRGVIYPDRYIDDPRFDCTAEAYGFPYDDSEAVPVEIPAGAALLFDGYLLHRSLQNSGRHGYRRALVHHYMSAESLLPWKEPEGDYFGEYDYRDIVLVAGEDPHAYKGIRDLSRAYSRPDKDGGCDR